MAFLVEVVAFVSLGVLGWQLGSSGPLVHQWIGLVAVLVVAVALWALFVSPQSVFDVPVLEIVLRIVIFGAGAVAVRIITNLDWGIAFGVVAAVNTALVYFGPFAR